jgi:hypothetical protein
MRNTNARVPFVAFAAIVAVTASCKTPDGPRYPIPAQNLSAQVPNGLTRVVFINTSNRFLYFESGPVRIQLDGNQLPSIWLDHYVQAFVEPGEYDLLLEHYDVIHWKGRHRIQIEGTEMFISVYNLPISTEYEILDSLPEDFFTRFKPGRDPANW